MFTKSKRTLTLFAITTAACLCCLTLAFAAKPDKPGGGGGGKGGGGEDPPLTGTVYFNLGGQMHSMTPDGSTKTPLPIFGDAEPSEALHGGHRWFLELREIPGEFYPNGTNGMARAEIFAVRDDGDETFTVQLTDQPDLQTFERSRPRTPGRWSIDGSVVDGLVSWKALRLDLTTGEPIEAGIYAARILFNNAGNVLGLESQPVSPLVDTGFSADDADGDGNPDTFRPAVANYDWAPDGTAIVWHSRSGLLIADILSNPVESAQITYGTFDMSPDWSPDGFKIVFEDNDGIVTINPDGTGRTMVLEGKRSKRKPNQFVDLEIPTWSPTSSHFVYSRFENKSSGFSADVSRAAADGSGNTNLTTDTDESARPVAWR